jgi:hypothetical protein
MHHNILFLCLSIFKLNPYSVSLLDKPNDLAFVKARLVALGCSLNRLSQGFVTVCVDSDLLGEFSRIVCKNVCVHWAASITHGQYAH